MRKRIARWLAGAALALAMLAGLAAGSTPPPVAHGADSTPTPTPLQTDHEPGGSVLGCELQVVGSRRVGARDHR